MSLLRWKELAKSKSELGDKINYARDVITKHNIGQQTSQESFAKVFKPVTSKLDDVIESNLGLKMLPRKKRPLNKGEVPDYGINIGDEVEDMGLDDLFFEQPVLPDSEKQIAPKPPTYEESWEDLLEGNKEVYVDPQYFPQDQELPPEYDDDEGIDYTMTDYDQTQSHLDDLGLPNYESIGMVLNQPEMTSKKSKGYLKTVLKNASIKRNQLKGYKATITKQYNIGEISDAERQENNKRIDRARKVLNEYISY